MFRNPPPRGREARAWLAAGAWLLSIYLAIPLARTVQTTVRDRGGAMLFVWITLLAGAAAAGAVVRAWFRKQWTPTPGQILALVVVFGAFAAGAWSLRANPEEAIHFVQYGGLGLLLFRALGFRLADPSIYVAGALLGTAAGTADELIQWLVPNRYFDYRDVGINALAGVLAQAALWAGIRPAFVRGRPSRRGIRLICAALAALSLLLLVCASHTPRRLDVYARRIPFFAALDEATAEYGHRIHAGPATVFFSRLSPADLQRQDRDRGAEAGRLAGAYPGDARYPAFLREHPAHRDPLAVEARIHVFRRDRYAAEARRLPPGPQRQTAAEIACREEEILRAAYAQVLAHSGFAWPPGLETRMQAWRGDPRVPYLSPVSQGLITRVSQRTLTILLAALLAAALAGERWAARRPSA